ncbi:MAG: AsmA family protein, partial [bacterium]|nr:AsmA family protein [bacterium]
MVKKLLIGVGIFLIILVVGAFIIPLVFKDDIKAAIDKELAKSINADVIFDVNNFDLTLFSNFPNVTVEIKDLGVFNRAPFEGTPLFVVEELEVELNLKDILFGDQLRLKGITLIRPQIKVIVLKDGKANYDITFPSTEEAPAATEEPSAFSFGIDHWQIVGGQLIYDDQSLPFYTSLIGLNHSGSGDFNEKEFDLKTSSRVDSLTVTYDGVEYLTSKQAVIDATIGISEEYTRFTFKDNTTKINDFAMSMAGWFKMNEKDYGMDIQFSSPENSFKSLLSLVPGIYTQDFGSIETKGDLSFTGFVKGTMSDTQ